MQAPPSSPNRYHQNPLSASMPSIYVADEEKAVLSRRLELTRNSWLSQSSSKLVSTTPRSRMMAEAKRWDSKSSSCCDSVHKVPARKDSFEERPSLTVKGLSSRTGFTTSTVSCSTVADDSRTMMMMEAERWESQSSGLSVQKPERKGSLDRTESDLSPRAVVRSAKLRGAKRWQSVSANIMMQKPERHDSREDLFMSRPQQPKRESSNCVTPASMQSRARMMQVARRWQSASLPKDSPSKPRRQKSIDRNDDDIRALFPPLIVTENKPRRKQKKSNSSRSVSSASSSSPSKDHPLDKELKMKKTSKRKGVKEGSKSFSAGMNSTDTRSFQMLQSTKMWTSTSSGFSPTMPRRQDSMDKEDFAAQLSPPANRQRRPKSRKCHSSRDLTRHEKMPEPFVSSPPLHISVPKKSSKRPILVKLASIRAFIQEKRKASKAAVEPSKTRSCKKPIPEVTEEASEAPAKIKTLKKERVGRMRKMLGDFRLSSSKLLDRSKKAKEPGLPPLEPYTQSLFDDESIDSNITGSDLSA